MPSCLVVLSSWWQSLTKRQRHLLIAGFSLCLVAIITASVFESALTYELYATLKSANAACTTLNNGKNCVDQCASHTYGGSPSIASDEKPWDFEGCAISDQVLCAPYQSLLQLGWTDYLLEYNDCSKSWLVQSTAYMCVYINLAPPPFTTQTGCSLSPQPAGKDYDAVVRGIYGTAGGLGVLILLFFCVQRWRQHKTVAGHASAGEVRHVINDLDYTSIEG
jgi:hypothetical protein